MSPVRSTEPLTIRTLLAGRGTLPPDQLVHSRTGIDMRAGNDINMVSYWLGHADLNTTHVYVEIDMETKRKMLEKTPAPKISKKAPWHRPHVLQWLNELAKGPELCAVNY